MIIGLVKEIKNKESRVALTPAGVTSFIAEGHQVIVEQNAGLESGFTNAEYIEAGASLRQNAADIWAQSEMVMKVKEPIAAEYAYFRKGLILFTYLHLAAEPELAKALKESGVTAIAYETVEVEKRLPLLTPMSEVAGRMSVQIGTQFLQKPYGGVGLLLAGVPGVSKGKVTIIGGGIVGTNAAKMAIGLGADVTILDSSDKRLRELDDLFGAQVQTLMSNTYNIAQAVKEADLLIGAVLIPGAKAPKLVTEEMVKTMKQGAVIVDVAIDQGGIVATNDRITTHENPTYEKYGVVHYSVANMPGAVPRTATVALTNVTLPYALQIAKVGVAQAIAKNSALKAGVNVANGHITYEAVANALGETYTQVEDVFAKVVV